MSTSTERAEDYPSSTPPLAHKDTPRIALACGAVLALVLVGGSLFWLLREWDTISGHTAKGRITATATSSPVWTPTEITPPAEATFYDTFINNKHGWSLSGEDGYLRILVDNMLILANTNPNTPLIESVPTSTTLDNYVVSIDFTLNQGDAHDSVGLYLRGDSHLDHDYRVDVNGNNTFDVAKEWLDDDQTPQSTMLVAPQSTDALRPPGNSNTLTVIMIDHAITVLINNTALITTDDLSYANGQVALFVHHGKSSKRVIVSFTRVEIDRLASPFATPVPTFKLTPDVNQP
ncbi:MAG TPA: family 16 glycoside hydrolase [Ktedonobacteraceae bacterium]|nr:family 16 glycoside hydrolase [Ktedonobacteraceae bacterium]